MMCIVETHSAPFGLDAEKFVLDFQPEILKIVLAISKLGAPDGFASKIREFFLMHMPAVLVHASIFLDNLKVSLNDPDDTEELIAFLEEAQNAAIIMDFFKQDPIVTEMFNLVSFVNPNAVDQLTNILQRCLVYFFNKMIILIESETATSLLEQFQNIVSSCVEKQISRVLFERLEEIVLKKLQALWQQCQEVFEIADFAAVAGVLSQLNSDNGLDSFGKMLQKWQLLWTAVVKLALAPNPWLEIESFFTLIQLHLLLRRGAATTLLKRLEDLETLQKLPAIELGKIFGAIWALKEIHSTTGKKAIANLAKFADLKTTLNLACKHPTYLPRIMISLWWRVWNWIAQIFRASPQKQNWEFVMRPLTEFLHLCVDACFGEQHNSGLQSPRPGKN